MPRGSTIKTMADILPSALNAWTWRRIWFRSRMVLPTPSSSLGEVAADLTVDGDRLSHPDEVLRLHARAGTFERLGEIATDSGLVDDSRELLRRRLLGLTRHARPATAAGCARRAGCSPSSGGSRPADRRTSGGACSCGLPATPWPAAAPAQQPGCRAPGRERRTPAALTARAMAMISSTNSWAGSFRPGLLQRCLDPAALVMLADRLGRSARSRPPEAFGQRASPSARHADPPPVQRQLGCGPAPGCGDTRWTADGQSDTRRPPTAPAAAASSGSSRTCPCRGNTEDRRRELGCPSRRNLSVKRGRTPVGIGRPRNLPDESTPAE